MVISDFVENVFPYLGKWVPKLDKDIVEMGGEEPPTRRISSKTLNSPNRGYF